MGPLGLCLDFIKRKVKGLLDDVGGEDDVGAYLGDFAASNLLLEGGP